jgi:putative holliday junction resolvase
VRILAIDLGTRRVGLALGDSIVKLATPYDVLTITTPQQALEAVSRIAQEESVEQLVVGVPLNMDDSAGPQAKQAILWGKLLGERTTLCVVFIDERLSSFTAEQQLADRKRSGEKLTHGRKKKQLDALAAASFLQQYFDGTLAPLEV